MIQFLFNTGALLTNASQTLGAVLRTDKSLTFRTSIWVLFITLGNTKLAAAAFTAGPRVRCPLFYIVIVTKDDNDNLGKGGNDIQTDDGETAVAVVASGKQFVGRCGEQFLQVGWFGRGRRIYVVTAAGSIIWPPQLFAGANISQQREHIENGVGLN